MRKYSRKYRKDEEEEKREKRESRENEKRCIASVYKAKSNIEVHFVENVDTDQIDGRLESSLSLSLSPLLPAYHLQYSARLKLQNCTHAAGCSHIHLNRCGNAQRTSDYLSIRHSPTYIRIHNTFKERFCFITTLSLFLSVSFLSGSISIASKRERERERDKR